MSYGCGDEDCTNCYGPANYAIVDADGTEVYDRYVDEATALEMIEDIGRGDDDLYPPDCYVEAQPDPRFEAKGLHPWADRADRIGPILANIPADETGWTRSVWFGDEVGGDEAVDLAYVAAYELPLTSIRTECYDFSYYVYGEPGDYGVVEQTSHYFRTDGEREDEEETTDEGQAPSFQTLAKALAYCRTLAMTDQRWIFHL